MILGLGRKKSDKKEQAKKKADPKKGETATKAEEKGVVGEPSIEDPRAMAMEGAAQPSTGQAGPLLTAKTVTGPPADEIYVDGISSLSFRANVVKMDCYRVVGQDSGENTENRMVSHRLVMPATALQELIRLLQNASERQKERVAAEAGTEKAN